MMPQESASPLTILDKAWKGGRAPLEATRFATICGET
jgi:hypothetical protein